VPSSHETSDQFSDLDHCPPFIDEESEEEVPVVAAGQEIYPKTGAPFSHPCVLVRALEDMESFMGVDGRIYSLSKGDIVTLPERNAAVLSERNIVLNINLCK
jgi:DNA replication factor GINS